MVVESLLFFFLLGVKVALTWIILMQQIIAALRFVRAVISLSEKISAVVGTSPCVSSAGISFSVCCHSNGQQLQTKQDVKFFISFLIVYTGADSLENCV